MAAQIALAPPASPGSFSPPITRQGPGAGALMAQTLAAARLVPSAKTKAVSLVHTSSCLRGDLLMESDTRLKLCLVPALYGRETGPHSFSTPLACAKSPTA